MVRLRAVAATSNTSTREGEPVSAHERTSVAVIEGGSSRQAK